MYRHWNLDLFVSAVLLVFCFFAGEATALSDVTGIVKDDAGKPVRGAFVSATTPSGFKSISVFTNAAGRYRIANVKPDTYVVSAWGWGWETKEVSKNISGDAEVNFTLAPKWDPDLMMSAAEWMSYLPQNVETAEVNSCLILCHGPSFDLTRRPRVPGGGYRGKTAEVWEEGWRCCMDRWSGLDAGRRPVPENVIGEQVAILAKYFGPNVPLPRREQVKHREVSDAALRATFRIYKPRTLTNYTHGVDADANGNIWFVMFDKKANKIARLDTRTDEMQEISVPTSDSGPHTMLAGRGGQVNNSGLIYISQTYCNCFGVLDPKTNEYTEYKALTPGSPHGIAIDSVGNAWVTNTSTTPIGQKLLKFDPKAKKLSEYVLPGPAPRPPDASSDLWWQASARLNPSSQPSSQEDTQGWYGHSNCVDPEDKVWVSTSGNVVRFDPVTQETKFFTIPNSATLKGLSCPSDGNIWINSNTGHAVVKLDPRTGKTKVFPMPTPNGMPYGSVLDGRGRLWVADTAARSMVRIDLKTEEMTEYPIPDWFAVPSFIGVDPQGRAVFGEKPGGRVGILDPGDLN